MASYTSRGKTARQLAGEMLRTVERELMGLIPVSPLSSWLAPGSNAVLAVPGDVCTVSMCEEAHSGQSLWVSRSHSKHHARQRTNTLDFDVGDTSRIPGLEAAWTALAVVLCPWCMAMVLASRLQPKPWARLSVRESSDSSQGPRDDRHSVVTYLNDEQVVALTDVMAKP
jgi:hypothetical protein